MPGQLDHRSYREAYDDLSVLHDEWMHSSTGTSSMPQGQYEILPGDMVPHIWATPDNVPPGNHHLGFSPADVESFMRKLPPQRQEQMQQHGDITQPDVIENPDTSGQGTGRTTGGIHKQPKQKQKGGGGGGGGGGVNAQGVRALGSVPKLGNVPYVPPGTSSGPSGTMLMLLLGGGVLVVYFIWHKLRKSKSEDKEMDKKGD